MRVGINGTKRLPTMLNVGTTNYFTVDEALLRLFYNDFQASRPFNYNKSYGDVTLDSEINETTGCVQYLVCTSPVQHAASGCIIGVLSYGVTYIRAPREELPASNDFTFTD